MKRFQTAVILLLAAACVITAHVSNHWQLKYEAERSKWSDRVYNQGVTNGTGAMLNETVETLHSLGKLPIPFDEFEAIERRAQFSVTLPPPTEIKTPTKKEPAK